MGDRMTSDALRMTLVIETGAKLEQTRRHLSSRHRRRMMLADRPAVATVAVRDLAAAKQFYERTLGLKQISAEGQEAVVYATGTSKLIVYRSQFAGTNQATAVTWNAGDEIEAVVRDLKSRGVTFEHYDMPMMKREGDVHIAGGTRAAWFKDPDGNIHSIINR